MMEYRIFSLGIDHFQNDEDCLNVLAKAGWRVVTAYTTADELSMVILERTKK